ncbi:MAG TPA: FKBP-type peptidyl-prolyl cis-trans isomerase [Allosphingosinicella sp.]|nr:FKBP-type peptidyl-prolyl cis-trans isomerase [Allosphingosinicella sp.]
MLFLIAAAAQVAAPTPAPAAESPIVTTESGLRFQVLTPGTGRRPTRADAVQVSYEVRLARNDRLVERTRQPAGIPVSGSIPGFTEALLLMNEGGRYRFWVPARLAYGRRGSPGMVPPNADLVFTLTLLRIGRAAPAERR